jgi:hypothetical protein
MLLKHPPHIPTHSNTDADHAQVIRYKQLLLKQRDIMRTLTARLSQRDESIMALQKDLLDASEGGG